MKKRKTTIRSIIARVMTLVMAAVMTLGSMPAIPARAEGGAYPYMIFAVSDEEGAVTLSANNTGINGSVATNGSIAVIGGNCNINGTRTEHAGLDGESGGEGGELLLMPDLRERIENTYFTAGTEEHAGDYVLEEININVNTPIEGSGEILLCGNININAGIMAQEDIVLDGEVKNSGDVVLYSVSGNIVIDSDNVNLNGLVYAPFGEIRITSMNVNMNNVILIAQKVTIEANGINGGMNQGMAQFIGTEYNVIDGGSGNDHPERPDPENPDPEQPDPENSEIDWSADSDGDGLPDELEKEIGTDPEAADTDGDGLSDYEEVFLTGSDPLNPSSVQAGVSDADADSDGDGISNREELEKGLNPATKDSDYDGISDYDELYVYGTDPTNRDSDGDGIKDGDEINLGLDPLNGNTNGVPDGKLIIHQTVDADSEALAGVNTADSPYRLSMEVDASGYVEGSLDAGESPYADTIENDAILGQAVGLEYQGGNVESVTLKFEIAEAYRENTSGLYAQYSEANQGIRRLTVFCWVDGVNMMVPVRTQYDLEHHLVYAEVNELGTYCLIDRELWYEQLGIMPEDVEGLYENGIQTYAAVTDSEGETGATNTGKEAYALINGESKKVFLYGGHMYAVYAGPETWTGAEAYCESLGGHLAAITSQGEQNFIEEYVLTGDIAQRYWIGGYSESYPFVFQWVTGEEFNYTNWRDGEPNAPNELQIEIYGHYNGLYGYWNNCKNIYTIKGFICEWEEENVSGNGIRVYSALTWTALPDDFGAVSVHSTQDYDGDSLLDAEEIMFEHELYGEPDKNGEYELPSIGEVFDYASGKYGIELPEEWGLGDGLLQELFEAKVVLVLSDPTRVDTDGDLFMDGYSEATTQDGYYPYADPNPMVSDVTITSLAHDYISIDYEQPSDGNGNGNNVIIASYGGNQSWFGMYDETKDNMIFCNGTSTGSDVQKQGCGLIAAADTLLYMMIGEIEEDTTITFEKSDITVDIKDSYSNIDFETYIDYVTGISDYFKIVDGGINVVQIPFIVGKGALEDGVKNAGRALGYRYETKWNILTEVDYNLELIHGMIQEDIPVIFLYNDKTLMESIFNVNSSEEDPVFLYQFINMQYINNPDDNPSSHYMTITGIIEYSDGVKDLIGYKTMLKISSWGIEYYVDYDWYADHLDVNTNILYIGKC